MATKTIKIGLSDSDKAAMQAAVVALIKASLITAYSSSATYALGDFVYYDGKFYKCTTAISTAEAWTSGHWTEATLNDVIDAVNAAVADVDKKASIDEYYGTMGVGRADVSDNLTPYSDESGAFQDNPVISQGTGTDNNVAIVTTGNFAQLREKQGNTLPVTQLAKELNDTNWSSSSANATWNSGEVSFVASAKYGRVQQITAIQNHKYLLKAEIKLTSATTDVKLAFLHNDNYPTQATPVAETTSWQTIIVVKDGSTDYKGICVFDGRESGFDAVQVKNVICFDITPWPADIITDLLDHPDHFSWYYNGSLAYDAGSLENSDGVKLVCTHRNLFAGNDINSPQYVGHYYINSSDFSLVASSNYNLYRIRVVPNVKYFIGKTDGSNLHSYSYIRFVDKDYNFISGDKSGYNHKYRVFETPPTCLYVEIFTATDVPNIVDLELYYTEQEGGEGYVDANGTPIHYPYEEPTVVDTGSEVLRSAGDAHDVKLPDGTIQRNVGVVDLGTLNWEYSATWRAFYVSGFTQSKGGATSNQINSKGYLSAGGHTASDEYADKTISVNSFSHDPGYITIRDTTYGTDAAAFKAAMSGVYLHYELATPTTEQGTPFPENVDIDDYGMMYWLDEDDELVGIPQGAKFFYPVNYKGFVDDLHSRTDGDASAIALRGYTGDNTPNTLKDVIDYIDVRVPTPPSTAGKHYLTVTVAEGEDPVYAWEAAE